MSAGTSPRSISIASARCWAASSSARRSAGAWPSIGGTSPIAGTVRSASATASCGWAMVSRCSTRRWKSVAARMLVKRTFQSGAHPGRLSRTVFIDLETTGLSGGAGTVAFLVGLGFFDLGAFQVRQFLLTSHAAERALLAAVVGVFRGCRSARDLQRQDVRRSDDGDALGLPSHGAAVRRDPAFRHAPPGPSPLEAARFGTRRTGRWRVPAVDAGADAVRRAPCRRCARAERFRVVSSTSCEPAIRVRSSPCSSTTGSISCRWRPSPLGPSVSPKKALTPVATRMRRWPWAASTSAAATRSRAERCYRRAAGSEIVEVRGEALYRLGSAVPPGADVRGSGGGVAGAARVRGIPSRLGGSQIVEDLRRVRGRGARRSTRSTGFATTLRRGSWRCSRWRRSATPPARRPGAAKKGCGTGWRVSIRKSRGVRTSA